MENLVMVAAKTLLLLQAEVEERQKSNTRKKKKISPNQCLFNTLFSFLFVIPKMNFFKKIKIKGKWRNKIHMKFLRGYNGCALALGFYGAACLPETVESLKSKLTPVSYSSEVDFSFLSYFYLTFLFYVHLFLFCVYVHWFFEITKLIQNKATSKDYIFFLYFNFSFRAFLLLIQTQLTDGKRI